jgi:hypothetical protein
MYNTSWIKRQAYAKNNQNKENKKCNHGIHKNYNKSITE